MHEYTMPGSAKGDLLMYKAGDKVRHEDGAVGTVVSDHPEDGYATVKYDDHFGTCADPYEDIAPVKRWYLSGPMRGIRHFNFPAFHKAAAKLRAEGLYVRNPAETDNGATLDPDGDESRSEGFCRRTALANELQWIAMHADGIALLPGWQASSGACAELALAEALGLEVRVLT